ncbi:ABC transporter ATP-binding protein [Clostridium oceanicum]|uniref:ABC transporter ATP-binding protein n=1 Tax=Clostridium oceanicum TaxID=1543 RepID=A0ABP3UZ38_9CLOT
MKNILKVEDLKVSFPTDKGKAKAVNDISFCINKEESVAIVGESGSGKSVTAFSIMQCISKSNIESGKVLYKDKDLFKMSKKELSKIIGKDIAMIFQEPMTSLNPVLTVGKQISESFIYNKKMSKKEAMKESIKMLKLIGIKGAERVSKSYPYELSGGMRQRVMIAMAIASEPKLLIADEPTTALDVTIQAQILGLIRELKKKFHMSLLMITHDLGIVSQMSDRVIVMYAGSIMEVGSVRDIFKDSRHPYTKALLKSMPSITKNQKRLSTIKGSIPEPTELPKGCSFSTRCEYARKICKEKKPPLKNIENGRCLSCFKDTKEYLMEG